MLELDNVAMQGRANSGQFIILAGRQAPKIAAYRPETSAAPIRRTSQVREVGTHQQLLAQHGIYYKLYQLQYKDQEIPVGAGGQVTAGADD